MRAEAAVLLLLVLLCFGGISRGLRAPHIYPTGYVKTSMNATTNATLLFTTMLNASEVASRETNGVDIRSTLTREDVGLSTHTQRRTALNLTAVTWNLAELPVSTSPGKKDYSFFKQYRKSDVFALGVQECEDIKVRRFEGHRSKALFLLMQKSLGQSFECVARHKMGGMQIIVFAKKRVARRITGVHAMDVACGVGNVLTNKGAVCVLLRMRRKTLALINAHLAAHQTKIKERRADYHRIVSTLTAKAPKKWLVKGHSQRKASASGAASSTALAATVNTIESYLTKASVVNNEWFEGLVGAVGLPPDHRAPVTAATQNRTLPITNGKKGKKVKYPRSSKAPKAPRPTKKRAKGKRLVAEAAESDPTFEAPFDCLIFMGDLNYRVDYPRRLIETYIKKVHSNTTLDAALKRKKFDSILRHDQLLMERKKKRVFVGFSEASISFLPTFKYDVGSDQFDSSEKKRCPAWTDRILHCTPLQSSVQADTGNAAANGTLIVHQDAYYSIDSKHSDHRPVCGHFSIFL